MGDIFPHNLCESCRKKEADNCVRGPKEHCDDYKSELQWQFEHYVSEEDRRAIFARSKPKPKEVETDKQG
jgi:hypothetical protein